MAEQKVKWEKVGIDAIPTVTSPVYFKTGDNVSGRVICRDGNRLLLEDRKGRIYILPVHNLVDNGGKYAFIDQMGNEIPIVFAVFRETAEAADNPAEAADNPAEAADKPKKKKKG